MIAMAIQMGATVFDLEEAELCYAPQYGSAKDPVNLAGMVASNVMRGDIELASWPELDTTEAFLLDVREVEEFRDGCVEGAVNIPLGKLRTRLNELPRDREIWVYCRAGQRSYYACRFLAQNGFRVRNLSGGYRTYRARCPEERRQLCTSLKVMPQQVAIGESGRPLRARTQSGCFVCGQNNPHGLQIRFQRQADGEMTATWAPASVWEGFHGIVHGGVVSTVLDEAMSKAVAATGLKRSRPNSGFDFAGTSPPGTRSLSEVGLSAGTSG